MRERGMYIDTETTQVASWQSLIAEAETRCECELGEMLESYLVFMLMRQLKRTDLGSSAVGLRWLEQQHCGGGGLRDLGDECLTLAGLYPELARRRLVQVGYYVDIGRSAYSQLAERLTRGQAELFAELTRGFVNLVDVLHSVRALCGAEPLSAIECAELWRDSGSQRAARQLQQHSDGLLLGVDQPGLHRYH